MKLLPRLVASSLLGGVAFASAPAHAGINNAPPPGWLTDLAGQPLPTAYTHYTTSFQATVTNTFLTFVFRNDPGYFALDDVTLVDSSSLITPNLNLLTNPGFESGSSGRLAPGWTAFAQSNITFGGEITAGISTLRPHSGRQFWDDGATGGYDGISQSLPTTLGDIYTVGFWLSQHESLHFVGNTPTAFDPPHVSTNLHARQRRKRHPLQRRRRSGLCRGPPASDQRAGTRQHDPPRPRAGKLRDRPPPLLTTTPDPALVPNAAAGQLSDGVATEPALAQKGSGSVCDRTEWSVIEPCHCEKLLRRGNPELSAQTLARAPLDCRAEAGLQ